MWSRSPHAPWQRIKVANCSETRTLVIFQESSVLSLRSYATCKCTHMRKKLFNISTLLCIRTCVHIFGRYGHAPEIPTRSSSKYAPKYATKEMSIALFLGRSSGCDHTWHPTMFGNSGGREWAQTNPMPQHRQQDVLILLDLDLDISVSKDHEQLSLLERDGAPPPNMNTLCELASAGGAGQLAPSECLNNACADRASEKKEFVFSLRRRRDQSSAEIDVTRYIIIWPVVAALR